MERRYDLGDLGIGCGGQLNERDRLIGRLLLERGLATREILQRAATATQQRRQQSGQDVELLVVMVELGALTRPVAGQIWEAAAAIPSAASPPPTAPILNPPSSTIAPAPNSAPHPGAGTASFLTAGSASSATFKAIRPVSFDPTGELNTMGAPLPGDVLGFGSSNDGFSESAPTLMGNFDRFDCNLVAIGLQISPGNFGRPGIGQGPNHGWRPGLIKQTECLLLHVLSVSLSLITVEGGFARERIGLFSGRGRRGFHLGLSLGHEVLDPFGCLLVGTHRVRRGVRGSESARIAGHGHA